MLNKLTNKLPSKLPAMRCSGYNAAVYFTVLAVSVILTGCTNQFSKNNTTPASLPGAGQQTTSNTYTGTQSPGYWTLTLGDTQKVFSYETITNATASTVPSQGGYAVLHGIDNFGTTTSGSSAGMAIEIPSRTTILRPGDNTTAPVSMVQQANCFPVTGSVRYVYAGMLAGGVMLSNGNNGQFPAYGSFVVSTSADGKTWQFGDVLGYQLTTTAGTEGIVPGTNADLPLPSLFSGTCQASNGSGIVTLSANPAITVAPAPTFAFHPGGYFVMDQSTVTEPTGGLGVSPLSNSWIGFAMPQSSLSATVITGGTYSGFVYEPTPNTTVATQPMSLSPAFGVSATLAGGPYPNDDLTQTPAALYNLTLGKQDSVLNGVFPSATLVMPDPQFQCALAAQSGDPVKSGFDVNGNAICTTKGVAVVANPDGKYVIYFTGIDGTAGTGSTALGASLQMYLYQQ